jgi:deoxycytidylate deaminase
MGHKKHQKFIDAAIDEALKSSMRFKHGCVISFHNNIIAKGHNYRKSRVVGFSIHAEEAAVNELITRKWAGSVKRQNLHLYVVRVRKNGNVCNSKPCRMCSKRIYQIQCISKIFYSTDTGLSC